MNEAMGYIWANYKSKVNKGEKKKPKPFLPEEKSVFGILLLAGRLFAGRSAANLLDNTKRGLQGPPNFGRWVREFRFEEIRAYCVWAYADVKPMLAEMDRISEGLPPGKYYLPGHIGMEHYRHVNMAERAELLAILSREFELDEGGFRSMPQLHAAGNSIDGHAIKIWKEGRKPWGNGPMWRVLVSVDGKLLVWYEACDSPESMAKLKLSDKWPADIAMVLRAVESVGASATNPIHWPGDALFMAGMEIFRSHWRAFSRAHRQRHH